ncbi:MAG: tryptophan--tRNA ligase [Candidatus Colwellbacteria bacterium]|nr:tryptophan--tRNA ligase [Candidatus Colwellbacteria bacterium]
MSEKVVLTGFQPSGTLHIGNYLGAFKQAIELQGKPYKRFYFIADYHSLTQKYDPKQKAKDIFNIAVDALALGIDPKKSTFFIQSHVTEHANLAWILNTITPMGELERMVEYKEKISQGQNPNVGLFDYPVLMAADILLYDADFVPVGDDQRQHVELARTITRTFNNHFGKTFKEPKVMHNETSRIKSLTNPSQKMSKSIPSGCLFLSDSPAEIKRKIMAATTDSHKEIGYDPENRPAVSNLIDIYAAFSGMTHEAVVNKFKNAGYATFKGELATLISDFFRPFRAKRAALLKNKGLVAKILEGGAKSASHITSKKIVEIRKRVGLI